MGAKKILLIPLDERPCNYNFPAMLAAGTDFELVMPPREILGKKKQPGDTAAIWRWFEENAGECDDAVISIDTLLYSGIVPSRLHHDSAETLLRKLDGIRGVKERHPGLRLYAFSLIMRNPRYSSADEEPDYYGQWGREIHRWGYIGHREELGIATEAEKQELSEIKARLPQEYLKDYLDRRAVNIQVNEHVVELAAEGLFDFVIFPQDDSSPYGLTAKDQQRVRDRIDRLGVNLKVYMYPDADAVANTLLARVVNREKGRRPLTYVRFASSAGSTVIPSYEDRIVGETVKYQILAAGGLVASSAAEADLLLLVNVPGGPMQDLLQEVKYGRVLQPTLEYAANRNLIELIEYADYATGTLGKPVIFADIAYCNGGDPLLFELLRQKGLLWKLAGYAGWNTSSNTLGTCIPMGMLFAIYGETPAHHDFLALRYLEDIGFMAQVRRDVTVESLPSLGLGPFALDGPRGKAAALVREGLQRFADEKLAPQNPSGAPVTVADCWMPWNRMFEVGLLVNA